VSGLHWASSTELPALTIHCEAEHAVCVVHTGALLAKEKVPCAQNAQYEPFLPLASLTLYSPAKHEGVGAGVGNAVGAAVGVLVGAAVGAVDGAGVGTAMQAASPLR